MRVLVYGDLNLDILLTLEEDVVELKDVSYISRTVAVVPGGCGGNVSVALSRLSQEPVLVSSIGGDVFGKVVLEDLIGEGISAAYIKRIEKEPTGVMVIILRRSGKRTIIGYRGANLYNILSEEDSRTLVSRSDYTYISGFTCGNVDGGRTIEYLIGNSVKQSIPVGIDLGGVSRDFLLKKLGRYRGMIYDVFLNLDELMEVFGNDFRESISSLASVLMPKNIFLKMGDRGSIVYSEGRIVRVEVVRVDKVVDTTGCGDAYNAGTIYGLRAGLPPAQRAVLGNLMGAFKAMGLGAKHLPKSLDELKKFAEAYLGKRELEFLSM